jgi:putative NIF3 family GTP cyclohydrolase 1 type 2
LPWKDFQQHLASQFGLGPFQVVDAGQETIRRVAVACGAAGEYLTDAHQRGCEAFVIGETRFHTCLEAKALGVSLVLLGHYASERPALEMLARRLAQEFPALKVWASQAERDPISWVSAPM